MNIFALYAALLAILVIFLSIRIIRLRRLLKVGLGDSGHPQLIRAMRVHANFAEYVPLTFILIFAVEQSGAHRGLIHALGLTLLIARLLHAYGVSQTQENFKFRVSGMVLTFTVLLVSALLIVLRNWVA